ncbi:MAG: DHH family protein [Candidatus Thermoplasmatota archaeon]|nr:DHH family protein [Candidatus Thermoplasmatota archaeon]
MMSMLIIHHWDTDGIASAAKLVKALDIRDYVNMSPDIGDFSFGQRIKDEAKKHDEIYVLDLNLPEEAVRLGKKLTFIDHHLQDRIDAPGIVQINPLVEGSDPMDHPSCTSVLSDHFGQWDLLSALGAVGDIGKKALDHPKVKDALDRTGIGIDETTMIVSLIDSNYLAVDLEAVESAVDTLLRSDVRELLDNSEWNRKLNNIEKTIRTSIEKREEIGRFAVIDFRSPYNIISKLARKAVWEMGYNGALVINRDFHGKGQTYFRIDRKTAERIDMASIIGTLKEMGINAGGKKEVVGSVYPGERTEEVLSIIRPYIR